MKTNRSGRAAIRIVLMATVALLCATAAWAEGIAAERSGAIEAPTAVACEAESLDGIALPLTIEGSTDGAGSAFAGSCEGTTDLGSERVYLFTPPSSGFYRIDTFGSALDTVLYVRAGACDGAEKACNDDALGGGASSLTLGLPAGIPIAIFVDGFGGASGDFVLHISRVPRVTPTVTACQPEEIDNSALPLSVSGSTNDGSNSFAGSCGEGTTAGGRERVFLYTPPGSGLFQIDTFGSELDTVLYVREGSCDGAEKACNDDAQGAASAVTVGLTEGVPIVIFVDGFGGVSGNFVLNIGPSEAPTPSPCRATALESVESVSASGSTRQGSSSFAGSCGASDRSADQAFLFTPPVSGSYRIDTAGSDFDTVLYVRAGDCDGAEVGCNDDAGEAATSSLTMDLNAGAPIVILVDGYAGASGDFVLSIARGVAGTPSPSPTRTPTPAGDATSTRTPSPTFTATQTATPTPPPCLGDCSGDARVTVDELVLLVRSALGDAQAGLCSVGNPSGTSITREELLGSIENALAGCGRE